MRELGSTVKIVCAWCNTIIGGRGSLLSHGICKRCFADMFQPQFDFMRSLPAMPRAAKSTRLTSLARPAHRIPREHPGFVGFN